MLLPITNPADYVVWFDLDDTLWDFRHNSHEALAEVYDHFGLDRFWFDVDAWRDSYHEVNDALWVRLAEGAVEMQKLRWDRFFVPLIRAGATEEEASEIASKADTFYLARLGMRDRTMPGARETVEKLKKRGFRIGVLSNGFRDVQYNKLRSAGFEPLIDYVVLSEDADASKPHTKIFRYAQKIARVKAEHCIMIGDNEHTDIIGAIKALWPMVIWYNPGHRAPDYQLVTDPPPHTSIEIIDNLCEINL